MTKTFDVVGKKKYFYIFSCLIIALSIILSFVIKTNVAIEFKGGTIVTYSYNGELSDSALASAAKEATGLDCNVTFGESLADGLKTASIVFPASEGISAEVQSAMSSSLSEKFPENALELYNSQDVDPSTGKGFFGKCIMAVSFAAVILIVFIGIRFRKIGGWVAGCCSVIALIHDLFFVYFCTLLCGFGIDSNFIAVLLTILGYSVNATIVIYDRIRENRRLYGQTMTLADLANASVSQSFTRTVHTTVTTVIAMSSICIVALIAGVESIISFAFPMVIGLLAGVYSSNCIAPTLWVLWQGAIDRKKAKKA